MAAMDRVSLSEGTHRVQRCSQYKGDLVTVSNSLALRRNEQTGNVIATIYTTTHTAPRGPGCLIYNAGEL